MKKWLIGVFLLGAMSLFLSQREGRLFRNEKPMRIRVFDGSFEMVSFVPQSKTVEEMLSEMGVVVGEHDRVFPEKETRVFSGDDIYLTRGYELRVMVDTRERGFWTEAPSVEEALLWEGISLDEDDRVQPKRETRISDKMRVVVTRVEVREEIKESKVPFETVVTEDEKLSWRKKIVTRKGENGIKSSTYRVAYHDGKEVNRKLLRTEITKEPESELVTQGTLVQVGKSHRGAASWYAYTGTLAAANPWLPKGSYVRVTNMDNGKSVIVVINDRGPFAPGRIIDLDKVAFMKIASLGAGVINVKMEEIKN